MDKSKKHVGFSESVEGERVSGDLLRPQTSNKKQSIVEGISIPTRTQTVNTSSNSLPSPAPFSPDYPTIPGGSSFGPYTRSRSRLSKETDQRDLEPDEPTGEVEHKSYGQKDKLAPETAITLFAFRLAILEKIASNLGTVAFLWATVVLLGGFATTAKITDFWVVAVLLFTEGVRIFGRSHELEWQHVASKATTKFSDSAKRATTQVYKIGSDAVHLSSRIVRTAFHSLIHKPEDAEHGVDAAVLHQESNVKVKPATIPTTPLKSSSAPIILSRGDNATKLLKKAAAIPGGTPTQMKRTWSTDIVPFIPYTRFTLFSSQAISLYLYWLQIASAVSSIGLSTWRLYEHDFTDAESELSLGKAADNLVLGLVLFYGLALAEAAIFLFERAYWELKLSYENLLVKVSDDYNLPKELQPVVKDFFYEVYSKSLNGSIFEGLDMDLVPFGLQLIQSDSPKLQLQGCQLLTAFVMETSSAEETLRRIGSTPGMFERLIEMLSWHNENEEQIRTGAAEIVSRLVFFNRNTFRIAGIAGAVEGIVCLLNEQELEGPSSIDTSESAVKLRALGLRILKHLSKDHSNRAKIGASKGLLPMLVTFVEVRSKSDLHSTEAGDVVRCLKKSLQILIMMASAPGHTGGQLRASILHVITAVRNLRDILQYGSEYPNIQKYAVELLTKLAMDDDLKIREYLGSTGGLIKNLLQLLLVKKSWSVEDTAQLDLRKEQIDLAEYAGKALNLLALQNAKNCRRMIAVVDFETGERVSTLQDLMELVSDRDLGATAAKILRSFCQYASPEDQAQMVTIIPVALQVLRQENDKYQEAALGLAARAIQVMHQARKQDDVLQEVKLLDSIFADTGVDKKTFVQELFCLIPLRTTLPRLRRHAVELMCALMDSDTFFVTEFREAGLERKLHMMLDTIWDIENFYTFSGTVGLSRHEQDMEDLVWSALSKLGSPIPSSSYRRLPSAP